MDEATPLEVDPTLVLYSLLSLAAFAAVIVGAIVQWSRRKPAMPLTLLTGTMLFGLVTQPMLAIVAAILLAALIIAMAINRRVAKVE